MALRISVNRIAPESTDTKATLHRFAQIIGKIRLGASVRRNHRWNVPFQRANAG